MILCSSGVLFEANRPHVQSILALGPLLPVEGLEVLVPKQMVGDLSNAATELGSSDLKFPVVHAPKLAGSLLPSDEGVHQLRETFRFARSIGAGLVVLHLWDLPESDRDFAGRLDAAVLVADLAEAAGVTVAVETIPCLAAAPLGNVERVVTHEPRLAVALDTEFLAFHGELEAALESSWLWQDNIVRHIHLKDYESGLFDGEGNRRYLALGEGAIDFSALFRRLEEHRFAGFVSLESAPVGASGGPDIGMVSESLERISRNPWCFR